MNSGRNRAAARRAAVIVIILVGLVARVGLLRAAPAYGFFVDHLYFVVWSEWAYRHGPTALYDLPDGLLFNAQLPVELSPEQAIAPFPGIGCNYGPLATYIMAIQGWLRSVVDTRVVARPVPPELAEIVGAEPGVLHSPVANTFTTRAVTGLLPTVADFTLAWGVAMLVAGLRPGRRGWLGVWAFGIVALAPPVMLNSALWGQTDSIVACLLVWCLVGLVQGRFGWAGAAYAAAVTFKAQAILLVPVLVLVLVALDRRDGRARAKAALGRFLGVGAVLAVLTVLPHMLAGAGEPGGRWLRWFDQGYASPIVHQYPLTTLRAFNVWWLDFLLRGQSGDALNPHLVVAGLSKQTWGGVLLAAAVSLSAVACVARWRWKPEGWVALAALVTLATFLFPTRAHERFVYYCVPFLVAVSLVYARWWPATLVMIVVASFEMTWNLWLAPVLGSPDELMSPAAAAGSMALAVLAVASFVYALLALVPWPRAAERSAGRVSG